MFTSDINWSPGALYGKGHCINLLFTCAYSCNKFMFIWGSGQWCKQRWPVNYISRHLYQRCLKMKSPISYRPGKITTVLKRAFSSNSLPCFCTYNWKINSFTCFLIMRVYWHVNIGSLNELVSIRYKTFYGTIGWPFLWPLLWVDVIFLINTTQQPSHGNTQTCRVTLIVLWINSLASVKSILKLHFFMFPGY